MTTANEDAIAPLSGDVGRATHLFFGACAASFIAFLVWASIGTLDIVSMAQGEVIPSTQVKSIQHLEGGIVRRILVREGERVTRGQELVDLEPTASGADVGELGVRIASLRVDIDRLEAEAAGAARPEFDADLTAQYPQLIRPALEQFQVRRQAQQSRIATQKEAIVQRQQTIEEIGARIRQSKQRLKLQEEQIAISEQLLKEDLTNRYVHLDLLKTAAELKGRIEEDSAALLSARAALKEAQSQLTSIDKDYQQEVAKQLNTARTEHDELTQRIHKYKDSLKRTVLRAPVDGIVKALYVTTVGGVIRAGDTVIDVVPGEDRLIVEAKLPTHDIGYVQVGQKAAIRLTSSDARRFGALDGRVVHVSPDTLLTPDGNPFYKVRIETERDHFEWGKERYLLFPGMQVMASIQTGERTVMQYLLDPLVWSLDDAMQER